jgi:hypothetical protein
VGALRVRQAARVSLGHLPRRSDARSRIGFGDFYGQPVWQEVPGEFRNQLRRLIVTQGDTEPASVEQQRLLGHRCPSLYDLRNLFQVNVEEGRHLWAMVYLLHSYFGRDGRDEAEELLERQSGNRDKPRILEAFNEPIDNWLDFFMFTMFTDRDGKSQLMSLSESSLDPLSRTTRFMLTEEAHHMFVGETGIARILERTCQLMKQAAFSEDVRKVGGIDIPTIQKHLNQWFSLSLDLHGSEVSSNAASYFANGLKGRAKETPSTSTSSRTRTTTWSSSRGQAVTKEVLMRNAMNEVLRDWYVGDCAAGVVRWNRILEAHGMSDRLRCPIASSTAASACTPASIRSRTACRSRGAVGEAEIRVAAVGEGHRVPAEHHGQAGLRAGQVRELHRAAAARHQPAADRLRVRQDRAVEQRQPRKHETRKDINWFLFAKGICSSQESQHLDAATRQYRYNRWFFRVSCFRGCI